MYKQHWNDGWKFWEEINAFALAWTVPPQAREVLLPHDAMLEHAPRPDSPNGNATGYRDGGNYVYVKRFFAPEDWQDRTVQVRFDGVYCNAMVFLNGQLVGKRPNGYVPFTVSLNDYLNCGGENELRVLVKNGAPNSRWYPGGGIYRDVWLLEGDLVHLRDGGVKVTTRYAEEDYAALSVCAAVCSRDHRLRPVRLRVEIYRPDGTQAACVETPLALKGGGEETVEQHLTVDAPELWSAETPALYRCVVRLTEGEREIGRTEESFGIRTLRLDARRGLQVNGRTVKLRGACIHHDNGLLGAVSLEGAEERRVRILKQAGFNAIRMSHHPASPALLRACDRLGMYVMDEAFDMWSRPKTDHDYALFMDKWWRQDVTAMVEKDFNHPSVLFYSMGNEIPEVGTAQGSALGREMARLTKALDPGRFVLVSVNGIFAAGDDLGQIAADVHIAAGEETGDGSVNDFMAAKQAHLDEIVVHPLISKRIDTAAAGMDLMGYNYMTARYAPDAVNYPHRVVVGSETYPPDIARNWALVEALPNVIGDFTWTGWDYLGEAGVGIPAYRFGEGGFGANFPCVLAYCGDMDLTGQRRPISYLRQMVFGLRKKPYITVQDPNHYGERLMKTAWIFSDNAPSWNWSGCEEKPVTVEVYSPGTEVELIQDGVSLGRRAAGKAGGFRALFETVYRPGTLTAIAWEDEAELGRVELTTAVQAAELRLEAAEERDGLIYVDLSLRDGAGRLVPDGDVEVTLHPEGCALLGLGSGNPRFDPARTEHAVRTFRGRAMVILKREQESVTLTAAAENGLVQALTL